MNVHYDDVLATYLPVTGSELLYTVDRQKLRRFLAGYLEAISFTDGWPDGDLTGLDLTVEGPGGWGDGQISAMLADADRFILAAQPIIASQIGLGDLWTDGGPYTIEKAATDFWLTRNGHGAGFWDRSFTYGEGGDPVVGLGYDLSALVGHGTAFPKVETYVGDDGRAYLI
jgi:hypothetical protein